MFANFLIMWQLCLKGSNFRYFQIFLMCALMYSSVSEVQDWILEMNRQRLTAQSLQKFKDTTLKDCLIVYYYGSSSAEYALGFGDEWSSQHYSSILKQLYPNAIIYNIWTKRFYAFGDDNRGELIRKVIKQNGCIALLGGELNSAQLAELDFTVKKMFASAFDNVYKILALR
jgi:hypothetical protein